MEGYDGSDMWQSWGYKNYNIIWSTGCLGKLPLARLGRQQDNIKMWEDGLLLAGEDGTG
jgi:hypothetical protein